MICRHGTGSLFAVVVPARSLFSRASWCGSPRMANACARFWEPIFINHCTTSQQIGVRMCLPFSEWIPYVCFVCPNGNVGQKDAILQHCSNRGVSDILNECLKVLEMRQKCQSCHTSKSVLKKEKLVPSVDSYRYLAPHIAHVVHSLPNVILK